MIGANELKTMKKEDRGGKKLTHASRILLAEDDVEMRKMLSWSLKRSGYEVLECKDGNSLMKHLERMMTASEPHGFEVIISDIRMPGYTGLQALENACELREMPPVIVITAFPDEEIREELHRLGVVKVFEKPFDVDDLVDEVNRIVPSSGSMENREGSSDESASPDLTFPLAIVYRHGSVAEHVKAFLYEAAEKLNPYGGKIMSCSVIIDELISEPHLKPRYRLSIHVNTSGNVIVVQHDSDEGPEYESLYHAIRIAFSMTCRKLKHRLGKHRKNKKRPWGERDMDQTISPEDKGE